MTMRLRPGLRPSYANVVSTLALVVAVSGGAYAATQLPKNSVGSHQIKNNTVKSKDLKDRGLKAKDLKAGAAAKNLAGAPMGGDLTGAFPNPTLDSDVLADVVRDDDLAAALADTVSPGELDDAIAGALDDGVLLGDRDDTALTLPAPSTIEPLVSIPDLVSVTVRCSEPPASSDRGLEINVTNDSPGTLFYTLHRRELTPATDALDTDTLLSGTDADYVFAPDNTPENVRYLRLVVVNGPLLEIEISAVTNNLAGGCNVRGSAFLDGNGPV